MRARHVLLPGLAAFLFLLGRCTTQQDFGYDPPLSVSADSQMIFVDHWRKGKVLYEMNCGGCHDTLVGGHKVVPDFSVPQLLDYEMRFQYPSHDDRLREVNVSIAELDDIQTYLIHKKRSGVPISPPPAPQPPPKVN